MGAGRRTVPQQQTMAVTPAAQALGAVDGAANGGLDPAAESRKRIAAVAGRNSLFSAAVPGSPVLGAS